MNSIGVLTDKFSATGHQIVKMFLTFSKTAEYCLENPSAMPNNVSEYGLFTFEPSDQFCKWIDPNSVELGKFLKR